MNVKERFVELGKRSSEVEEFLKQQFQRSGYSHSDIRRTPLGMRITVYADKPGLVIGRGGEKIKEITEKLKNEFGYENPQVDVKEVETPYLNAQIVAKEIASAIEKGVNYRRIGNLMLRRIMDSRAVGVEIKISGKLGSARGRTEKFIEGHLKHSGEPAEKLVDYAKEIALTKPGSVGIQVKIMAERQKFVEIEKPVKEEVEKPEEEVEKKEVEEEKLEHIEKEGPKEKIEKKTEKKVKKAEKKTVKKVKEPKKKSLKKVEKKPVKKKTKVLKKTVKKKKSETKSSLQFLDSQKLQRRREQKKKTKAVKKGD